MQVYGKHRFDGSRGVAHDPLSKTTRFVQRLTPARQVIDQPVAMRLPGVQTVSGQAKLQRLGWWNFPGKAKRAARDRENANTNLGQTKHSIVTGHDQITGQSA